jgi:hypothetical protein
MLGVIVCLLWSWAVDAVPAAQFLARRRETTIAMFLYRLATAIRLEYHLRDRVWCWTCTAVVQTLHSCTSIYIHVFPYFYFLKFQIFLNAVSRGANGSFDFKSNGQNHKVGNRGAKSKLGVQRRIQSQLSQTITVCTV